MPKKLQSQWEFGELFPAETVRRVLSVSDLTGNIRQVLEKQFGLVLVSGEITNLRLQSSGHTYFSIKDLNAQLSCVLFRGDARQLDRALLKDGQKVVLEGQITVYEPRGQYQLRVTHVELQGLGALQAAFEKLKQKLNAEGLFAQERKRPLPPFPQHVGLVTSKSGAAIRDILHVIHRRNPALQLTLAHCRVQGMGAAEEIACALRLLNDWNATQQSQLDCILVTRGGGSIEDLWAFNEETVARAIFESRLPVVSAVGHEIDFTISDFVADLRAATPSAAAEILTQNVVAARPYILEAPQVLLQLLRGQLADKNQNFNQLARRLLRLHPKRKVQDLGQRVDDLNQTLARCLRRKYHNDALQVSRLVRRLARLRPSSTLPDKRRALLSLTALMHERSAGQFQRLKNQTAQAEERLRLLSPQNVLNRGYSITSDAASGQVLRSSDQVAPNQRIRTRLKSGEFISIAQKPG